MKKIIMLLGVCLLLLITACGGNGNNENNQAIENNTENQNNDDNEEENGSIEVEKNLLSVEITLPASMFAGEQVDVEQVIAEAKADGIDDVTYNDDGSFTYKMSKAKHKEIMEDYKEQITASIEEMINSDDFVSIKDITANKSFSEFTMIVDKVAFENSFDGFAAFGLGISGMIYQAFDGVDSDDYKVTIYVKDVDSGDVFDTIIYPDDMG